MADQMPPSSQSDDIPIEEARRTGRSPRMAPMLYEPLRQKIQSPSSGAVRIRRGQEITPQRMKKYLPGIAAELGIPVTVRRVPDGVIFWRSSEEDLQQAQEAASRLQTGRQTGRLPSGAHRPAPAGPGRGAPAEHLHTKMG